MASTTSTLLNRHRLNTTFNGTTVTHITRESNLEAKQRRVEVRTVWNTEHKLGAGAFGIVWRQRSNTGQLRAVKIVSRERLKIQEVEALIELQDHPDLFILFLGWFEDIARDTFHIAMEYIEYGDLAKYITQYKTKVDAKVITLQILEGLVVLHERSICHRDLKPQNILVASLSPIWVKITDFGISKRWIGTSLKTQCGTPVYRSPEQLGILPHKYLAPGNTYTSNIDIWALGAIVHEMLTQEIPFLDTYTRQDPDFTLSIPVTSEPSVDIGLLFDYCRGLKPFPCGSLRRDGVRDDGIDFVKRLMAVNPSERSSAAEALTSPWLVQTHSTSEPASTEALSASLSPAAGPSDTLGKDGGERGVNVEQPRKKEADYGDRLVASVQERERTERQLHPRSDGTSKKVKEPRRAPATKSKQIPSSDKQPSSSSMRKSNRAQSPPASLNRIAQDQRHGSPRSKTADRGAGDNLSSKVDRRGGTPRTNKASSSREEKRSERPYRGGYYERKEEFHSNDFAVNIAVGIPQEKMEEDYEVKEEAKTEAPVINAAGEIVTVEVDYTIMAEAYEVKEEQSYSKDFAMVVTEEAPSNQVNDSKENRGEYTETGRSRGGETKGVALEIPSKLMAIRNQPTKRSDTNRPNPTRSSTARSNNNRYDNNPPDNNRMSQNETESRSSNKPVEPYANQPRPLSSKEEQWGQQEWQRVETSRSQSRQSSQPYAINYDTITAEVPEPEPKQPEKESQLDPRVYLVAYDTTKERGRYGEMEKASSRGALNAPPHSAQQVQHQPKHEIRGAVGAVNIAPRGAISNSYQAQAFGVQAYPIQLSPLQGYDLTNERISTVALNRGRSQGELNAPMHSTQQLQAEPDYEIRGPVGTVNIADRNERHGKEEVAYPFTGVWTNNDEMGGRDRGGSSSPPRSRHDQNQMQSQGPDTAPDYPNPHRYAVDQDRYEYFSTTTAAPNYPNPDGYAGVQDRYGNFRGSLESVGRRRPTDTNDYQSEQAAMNYHPTSDAPGTAILASPLPSPTSQVGSEEQSRWRLWVDDIKESWRKTVRK